MPLQLIPATTRDTDFIVSLVLFGARKGHFYPELASNKAMLRTTVESILRHGVQGSDGLRTQAAVGWDNGERVGLVITSDTEKQDNSIELSLIAVRKEYQRHGYGSQLLDAFLNRWLPRKTIYVRCFPESELLFQMLLRRQFILAGTIGQRTRLLRRSQHIQPSLC